MQQLLWRLVHVVRPGDSDDASGTDSDSPFDTEVFDSHRERALAGADDSAASGSGSHAYRPGPLPEDRNVSADSADAEARRAAGRFFRLSRFRPGGNRSSAVMGEEESANGTPEAGVDEPGDAAADLHDRPESEPGSRTDA